jgi:hypothetical protein
MRYIESKRKFETNRLEAISSGSKVSRELSSQEAKHQRGKVSLEKEEG